MVLDHLFTRVFFGFGYFLPCIMHIRILCSLYMRLLYQWHVVIIPMYNAHSYFSLKSLGIWLCPFLAVGGHALVLWNHWYLAHKMGSINACWMNKIPFAYFIMSPRAPSANFTMPPKAQFCLLTMSLSTDFAQKWGLSQLCLNLSPVVAPANEEKSKGSKVLSCSKWI